MSAQEQETSQLETVKDTPQPPASIQPVQINNLVIQKQEREILAMGDADSFLRYADRLNVKAVVWNEKYLAAVTDDRRMLLAYQPELEPTAEMFFMREERRRTRDFMTGDSIRVWDGEYSAVEFTKGNLIKFLQTYGIKGNDELIKAVKNLRVVEKTETQESMIDLGSGDFNDDNVRTVEEQTSITNIPTKFTIHMQVTQTFSADLAFEARVTKAKDEYGSSNKGKRVIELRVTNARDVMRGLMRETLDKLPKNVDQYYGKMPLNQPRD
jgi:hypothetical protein